MLAADSLIPMLVPSYENTLLLEPALDPKGIPYLAYYISSIHYSTAVVPPSFAEILSFRSGLCYEISQGSSLKLGPRVQIVENLRPREHAIHVAV